MTKGSIPPYVVRLVLEAARSAGVDRRELDRLPGVGVLDQDGIRVPTRLLMRVWEVSANTFAEVGGAPRVAQLWAPGRFHVWDYVIRSAADLTEAFRLAAEHLPAITDPDSAFDVRVDAEGRLTVATRPVPTFGRVGALIAEFVLGLLLQQASTALGRPVVPLAVTLPGEPPRSHDHLVEVFGTRRIQFGAPVSSITFSAPDASAPLPGADPALAAIVNDHAAHAIRSARLIMGWLDKVHAEIATELADGPPALDRVAHRLALSPRTFQRRLHDEGTSWREEVEKVREAEATRLLRDTGLNVDAIAARVGYTDVRALRRAFHRWHGRGPAEFRRQAVAGQRR
ncbi:AraC family transcriptional regulator ligand-binding domain-containing protein [Kitasatospora sp. NPDC058965]|uniref:AraC family transcriptional regulator n=1 Tax=Kitasatospora sp. NPDC058965 TaxID=3346682 RepID=UPI0036C86D38